MVLRRCSMGQNNLWGQFVAHWFLSKEKVGQAGEHRHRGRVPEREEEEMNKEKKFKYTLTQLCVGFCRSFEESVRVSSTPQR